MEESERDWYGDYLRLRPEGLIPLCDMAEEAGAHPAAMVRWIIKGKYGVNMEGARKGRRWHSSRQALARFVAATSERRATGQANAQALRSAEAFADLQSRAAAAGVRPW